MPQFLALSVLCVLLALAIIQLFRRPAASRVPQPQDLANLRASEARAGDAISISGAGDGFSNLDFVAEERLQYSNGSHRWLELKGAYRGRAVALRVDGETGEPSLSSGPHDLTIEDLDLSEDGLAQMDQRHNSADSFDYDGRTWFYQLSTEVLARPEAKGPTQGYYYWEFREKNGAGVLAIWKPQGEDFRVTFYSPLPPGRITVYRSSTF